MTWRHPTEADWDRERDYRKHEPRPGDALYEAIEIATLVKQVSTLKGAELIQQYGRTQAALGRMDGVADAGDRIMAALEAPLSRKVPA